MFVIQDNLHILSLMKISWEEDENVKNIYVFAWRVQSFNGLTKNVWRQGMGCW